MRYNKILQQAIDLHVHVGPEIVPRRFTVASLLAYEQGKLRGVGVKNHFFPTVAMSNPPIPASKPTSISRSTSTSQPILINSLVLNRYVGGFNPDIIRAAAELTKNPLIVWFPTLHTAEFLKSQEFEIPSAWLGPDFSKTIKRRRARDIRPLSILTSNGQISREVRSVLQTIKDNGAILATGHLAWREAVLLVETAVRDFGLKKIIVTHPIYQAINMPVAAQKKLAAQGALIEHCYSMWKIDRIPVKRIVSQIKAVGAENCLLSSDVGQAFSLSPSEALREFIDCLLASGINLKEITTMLVVNPNRLIAA